jgi:hypothetical protein
VKADNKTKFLGAVLTGALIFFLFRRKDETGGTSESLSAYDMDDLSYNENQYKILADSIEAHVWGSGSLPAFTEDDTAIGQALKSLFNLADIYFLIETYGRRYAGSFIQEGGNLVQTISEYLDEDIKDEVNATYQARGINFFWP